MSKQRDRAAVTIADKMLKITSQDRRVKRIREGGVMYVVLQENYLAGAFEAVARASWDEGRQSS